MASIPTDGTGRADPAPAGRRRRWACTGWGFPRTLAEVSFLHVAVILAVGLTVWGYVDVTVRGRIVPLQVDAHRTDFTVYTEAGAAFFDGRDPYKVTNPRGWFYLYPPLLALLVAPLAALDAPAQVGVWYLVSVVAAFGCYFEARRIARLVLPALDPGLGRWIGACAGGAVLLPTLDCLQRGQVGVVLLYLLLAGIRLALLGRGRRSWFLGGVVLALPVTIKLIPLLPVGLFLFQRWAAVVSPGRGPRPTARAIAATLGVGVGGFLFVFAIPAACVGWGPNLGHLRTWYGRVAANADVDRAAGFNIYSNTNQSLANAAHLLAIEVAGSRLEGIPPARKAAAVARRGRLDRAVGRVVWGVRGAVVALLLALGVATRGRGALDQWATFGLACAAILVVSPLSWGHYYMLELPALVGVALWLAPRARPGLVRVAAVVPALLAWAHYTALRQAGPIGLLGLGTTLWLFAAGIALLAASGRERPSRTPRAHLARPARLARVRPRG